MSESQAMQRWRLANAAVNAERAARGAEPNAASGEPSPDATSSATAPGSRGPSAGWREALAAVREKRGYPPE